MKPIRIMDEAYEDILKIEMWYIGQGTELGDAFLEELYATLEIIRQNPDLFEARKRNVRRALLRRFPYLVLYEEVEDAIEVLGVYHGRRNPSVIDERI